MGASREEHEDPVREVPSEAERRRLHRRGADADDVVDPPRLRTNEVSTHGAAVKVVKFDRLGWYALAPLGLIRVPKKSICQSTRLFSVTPLVLTPICLLLATTCRSRRG